LQLGALPQGSNAPAAIDFLLRYVPWDGADATVPAPDAPDLEAGDKAMLHLCEDMYLAALRGSNHAASGAGDETSSIAGASVNGAVVAIMAAEASKVAEGGLWPRVAASVRWAFENAPRNVPVALVRYWGDREGDGLAQLEVAYACARLGQPGKGLREAARALTYEQVRPRVR
jgi:hypothetical protein